MKGYFRKPKETAEAIDAEGWFHTGDIGVLDEDGFLTITDRKKEILVNSNGKNIAPAPIEGLLKGHPLRLAARPHRRPRKFLSCLIVPNFEKLAGWAKANGLGRPARRGARARTRGSLALFQRRDRRVERREAARALMQPLRASCRRTSRSRAAS